MRISDWSSDVCSSDLSDPVMARPGNKGCGFPMAMWNRHDEPLTFGASAIAARHLGGRPGLVDEDQVHRVQAGLPVAPDGTRGGDVRTFLLGGVRRLFFASAPAP